MPDHAGKPMTTCLNDACVALATDGGDRCVIHRTYPNLRPEAPLWRLSSRFVGRTRALGEGIFPSTLGFYVPPRLFLTPWTDEPHWTARYGPPSDAV